MVSGVVQKGSILQDESAMRWSFLEEETCACAVVTERMELVYLNGPGRSITPVEWFGKRCFEVLPTSDSGCAWECPTLSAVAEHQHITYCEESLRLEAEEQPLVLGTAVIPLPERGDDAAYAVLMFKPKPLLCDEARFREQLISEATLLRERIREQLG